MDDALKVSDAEAAKVAIAPRVTLEDLERSIASEHYIRANEAVTTSHGDAYSEVSENALACLTLCVLVTKSGFTVTGESACAAPENFNAELGRKFAREQAIRKLWAFEGFALRKRLSEAA
ncbi:Gp49 family protein [Brevundimonas olei]|uniref:Gp49 family protein n=1 Tax=Brevundimonas olei TaxID=657642 RepID=A0ABZ2IDQ7_9CAUL